MTKTLRNIVNGDTSRLAIVIDIRATDISLVRKFGRHSGKVSCNWVSEMKKNRKSTKNLATGVLLLRLFDISTPQASGVAYTGTVELNS